MRRPRLRTADKIEPPYPLGRFPADFAYLLGRQIVYHLATAPDQPIEGPEWERIFATAIGADWKPSNIGLDDIVLGVCAWGAKSVKNPRPLSAKKVRLISGRNSPAFSYGEMNLDAEPEILGHSVLGIWNGRVDSLRKKFAHLRTVVLIKSHNLSEFVVFETDTIRYPTDNFTWKKNVRGNLEGFDKATGNHQFTWQPHGSQFTIIEEIPQHRLSFRVKLPPRIDMETTLKEIGYNKSWIEILS